MHLSKIFKAEHINQDIVRDMNVVSKRVDELRGLKSLTVEEQKELNVLCQYLGINL